MKKRIIISFFLFCSALSFYQPSLKGMTAEKVAEISRLKSELSKKKAEFDQKIFAAKVEVGVRQHELAQEADKLWNEVKSIETQIEKLTNDLLTAAGSYGKANQKLIDFLKDPTNASIVTELNNNGIDVKAIITSSSDTATAQAIDAFKKLLAANPNLAQKINKTGFNITAALGMTSGTSVGSGISTGGTSAGSSTGGSGLGTTSIGSGSGGGGSSLIGSGTTSSSTGPTLTGEKHTPIVLPVKKTFDVSYFIKTLLKELNDAELTPKQFSKDVTRYCTVSVNTNPPKFNVNHLMTFFRNSKYSKAASELPAIEDFITKVSNKIQELLGGNSVTAKKYAAFYANLLTSNNIALKDLQSNLEKLKDQRLEAFVWHMIKQFSDDPTSFTITEEDRFIIKNFTYNMIKAFKNSMNITLPDNELEAADIYILKEINSFVEKALDSTSKKNLYHRDEFITSLNLLSLDVKVNTEKFIGYIDSKPPLINIKIKGLLSLLTDPEKTSFALIDDAINLALATTNQISNKVTNKTVEEEKQNLKIKEKLLEYFQSFGLDFQMEEILISLLPPKNNGDKPTLEESLQKNNLNSFYKTINSLLVAKTDSSFKTSLLSVKDFNKLMKEVEGSIKGIKNRNWKQTTTGNPYDIIESVIKLFQDKKFDELGKFLSSHKNEKKFNETVNKLLDLYKSSLEEFNSYHIKTEGIATSLRQTLNKVITDKTPSSIAALFLELATDLKKQSNVLQYFKELFPILRPQINNNLIKDTAEALNTKLTLQLHLENDSAGQKEIKELVNDLFKNIPSNKVLNFIADNLLNKDSIKLSTQQTIFDTLNNMKSSIAETDGYENLITAMYEAHANNDFIMLMRYITMLTSTTAPDLLLTQQDFDLFCSSDETTIQRLYNRTNKDIMAEKSSSSSGATSSNKALLPPPNLLPTPSSSTNKLLPPSGLIPSATNTLLPPPSLLSATAGSGSTPSLDLSKIKLPAKSLIAPLMDTYPDPYLRYIENNKKFFSAYASIANQAPIANPSQTLRAQFSLWLTNIRHALILLWLQDLEDTAGSFENLQVPISHYFKSFMDVHKAETADDDTKKLISDIFTNFKDKIYANTLQSAQRQKMLNSLKSTDKYNPSLFSAFSKINQLFADKKVFFKSATEFSKIKEEIKSSINNNKKVKEDIRTTLLSLCDKHLFRPYEQIILLDDIVELFIHSSPPSSEDIKNKMLFEEIIPPFYFIASLDEKLMQRNMPTSKSSPTTSSTTATPKTKSSSTTVTTIDKALADIMTSYSVKDKENKIITKMKEAKTKEEKITLPDLLHQAFRNNFSLTTLKTMFSFSNIEWKFEQDGKGKTWLMYALESQAGKDAVEYVLDEVKKRGKTNDFLKLKDYEGNNALFYAVKTQNIEMLKLISSLFLSSPSIKTEINSFNNAGDNILIYAMRYISDPSKSLKMIKDDDSLNKFAERARGIISWIVNNLGIDINQHNKTSGNMLTPLAVASLSIQPGVDYWQNRGLLQLIKILLDLSANSSITTKAFSGSDMTPGAHLIEAFGADVNKRKTPLFNELAALFPKDLKQVATKKGWALDDDTDETLLKAKKLIRGSLEELKNAIDKKNAIVNETYGSNKMTLLHLLLQQTDSSPIDTIIDKVKAITQCSVYDPSKQDAQDNTGILMLMKKISSAKQQDVEPLFENVIRPLIDKNREQFLDAVKKVNNNKENAASVMPVGLLSFIKKTYKGTTNEGLAEAILEATVSS